jgi:nucleoside-diphosphate-sugar epimerase
MARVVVIGATGNVGTATLDALAADERVGEVVAVARRVPDCAPPPRTRWAAADVVSDDLVPLLRGADCVVHLAWLIQPSRDRGRQWQVNVEGSSRVFRAALAAGVRSMVVASSLGVYSPGPDDPEARVDEGWPRDGVPPSAYSLQKAEVERRLDALAREAPEVRVVRMRTALVLSGGAASGIRRLFLGPLLPGSVLRPGLVPLVPDPGIRVQAVSSADVGEAYRLAATGNAGGPFNVAAEPVLDARVLARILEGRTFPVHPEIVRAGMWVSWRLRLQPTPPEWLDLGRRAPVMATERAHRELGWSPAQGADDALADLLAGLRTGKGRPTPPLHPSTGGPLRTGEVTSGVGARER